MQNFCRGTYNFPKYISWALYNSSIECISNDLYLYEFFWNRDIVLITKVVDTWYTSVGMIIWFELRILEHSISLWEDIPTVEILGSVQ